MLSFLPCLQTCQSVRLASCLFPGAVPASTSPRYQGKRCGLGEPFEKPCADIPSERGSSQWWPVANGCSVLHGKEHECFADLMSALLCYFCSYQGPKLLEEKARLFAIFRQLKPWEQACCWAVWWSSGFFQPIWWCAHWPGTDGHRSCCSSSTAVLFELGQISLLSFLSYCLLFRQDGRC